LTNTRPTMATVARFEDIASFRAALALWLHIAWVELDEYLPSVDAAGAIRPPVWEWPEEKEESR
jgi:hypothetical protein